MSKDATVALGSSRMSQATKLPPLGKYLVEIAIVCLAYIVAGKLGQATTNIRSSNLGPVWPAYGIALAAILRCGYRVWPGVAAGAFWVAFFSPVPHIAALGQAAGATIAAVIGAFLLHQFNDFSASLSRTSDVLGLIVFGASGSAMVSASIGVSVLYATHVHAYSGLGPAWLIYWLGDATGVLLVTPLALTLTDFRKLGGRDRLTEVVVLLLLLTTTCFIVFGDLPLIPVKLHVMAFAVLPFVIWAAIRFGTSGATLSVLLIASIATVATAFGSGPFAQNTPFKSAVLLDVFFAVLSVSGMTLAAVIAEREQFLRQQAQMEAQLRKEAVQEGEERLRLVAKAGKMYAYDWDAVTDRLVRSSHYMNILGSTNEPKCVSRQQALESVHPDDRTKCAAALARLTPENPNAQLSYRVQRKDGAVIWLEEHERAFFDEGGKILRVIGMVADVTERKLGEEALSNVSLKLIQAQEQERSRIARDLHDDVAQRLALLVNQLERLQMKAPDSVPELRTHLGELQKEMQEISTSIQTMSHELHSSKLEYLGLVAASRSFCKEFGEHRRAQVDFTSHDLPPSLPADLSLGLFRVLQEALHNAAKHSEAGHFDVQLWGTSDEIHLMVSDHGIGFDPEKAMRGTGLGLISMQERLRLIDGELFIESQPNRGTTIHARVHFRSSSNSIEAAS